MATAAAFSFGKGIIHAYYTVALAPAIGAVIAIGVPTVVHAVTIARDTLDKLIAELKEEMEFYEVLDQLYDRHRDALIAQVLGESLGDLMVTPKEIDAQIEDLSRLIAGALNTSLQPGIDIGEFALYS